MKILNPAKSKRTGLFDEAASQYGAALDRLVRAYEMNPAKQPDLLQEIHLSLWQSFEHYQERCSLRTWVYRVAHNTAASYVLKERRKNSAEWLTLEQVEEIPDPDRFEGTSDRQLALERLLALVHQLKPPDRQLILLYLEDMSAESIGEIAGLSAGAVRVQIHRIKAILARRFRGGPK